MLDAMKQCCAAGCAHIANVAIALFIADYSTKGDECAFYFVNGLTDTTLGVTTVYWLLGLVSGAAVCLR